MEPNCDWDDGVLPDGHDDGGEIAVVPGPGAIAVVPQQRPVRAREVAPSKSKMKLPGPTDQTYEQRCLAASHMRDGKARKRTCHTPLVSAQELQTALASMRDAGLLRDRQRISISIQRNGLCKFQNIGKQLSIPYEMMQELAYTTVERQNDVAKCFNVSADSVRLHKKLVAAASEKSDVRHMGNLSDGFEAADGHPEIFVTGLMCDATAENFIFQC